MSKFNLGDKVYAISTYAKKIIETCPACKGAGHIVHEGYKHGCSNCVRQGTLTRYDKHKWNIHDNVYTVGEITVTTCLPQYAKESYPEYAEKYMLCETGIHSGTIHKAEDLFSTCEEAEAECAKRNKD